MPEVVKHLHARKGRSFLTKTRRKEVGMNLGMSLVARMEVERRRRARRASAWVSSSQKHTHTHTCMHGLITFQREGMREEKRSLPTGEREEDKAAWRRRRSWRSFEERKQRRRASPWVSHKNRKGKEGERKRKSLPKQGENGIK